MERKLVLRRRRRLRNPRRLRPDRPDPQPRPLLLQRGDRAARTPCADGRRQRSTPRRHRRRRRDGGDRCSAVDPALHRTADPIPRHTRRDSAGTHRPFRPAARRSRPTRSGVTRADLGHRRHPLRLAHPQQIRNPLPRHRCHPHRRPGIPLRRPGTARPLLGTTGLVGQRLDVERVSPQRRHTHPCGDRADHPRRARSSDTSSAATPSAKRRPSPPHRPWTPTASSATLNSLPAPTTSPSMSSHSHSAPCSSSPTTDASPTSPAPWPASGQPTDAPASDGSNGTATNRDRH